jgi:hypothetical protein
LILATVLKRFAFFLSFICLFTQPSIVFCQDVQNKSLPDSLLNKKDKIDSIYILLKQISNYSKLNTKLDAVNSNLTSLLYIIKHQKDSLSDLNSQVSYLKHNLHKLPSKESVDSIKKEMNAMLKILPTKSHLAQINQNVITLNGIINQSAQKYKTFLQELMVHSDTVRLSAKDSSFIFLRSASLNNLEKYLKEVLPVLETKEENLELRIQILIFFSGGVLGWFSSYIPPTEANQGLFFGSLTTFVATGVVLPVYYRRLKRIKDLIEYLKDLQNEVRRELTLLNNIKEIYNQPNYKWTVNRLRINEKFKAFKDRGFDIIPENNFSIQNIKQSIIDVFPFYSKNRKIHLVFGPLWYSAVVSKAKHFEQKLKMFGEKHEANQPKSEQDLLKKRNGKKESKTKKI